jgi:hypothetical protein
MRVEKLMVWFNNFYYVCESSDSLKPHNRSELRRDNQQRF